MIWYLIFMPFDLGISSKVLRFPVPNLKKSWVGSPKCRSNWFIRQASDATFLECSEWTALSSRSVAVSVNKGSKKNWPNLKLKGKNHFLAFVIYLNYWLENKIVGKLITYQELHPSNLEKCQSSSWCDHLQCRRCNLHYAIDKWKINRK